MELFLALLYMSLGYVLSIFTWSYLRGFVRGAQAEIASLQARIARLREK